ncbi:MAG: hypothetical protein DWQ45_16870 [Planctomycetota bacterium]|nr:MAG: hypothetical protein DWQ45_16870 [Planctomycetota bacterium]
MAAPDSVESETDPLLGGASRLECDRFSKKLENLAAAVAIHIACFNFCRRSRENVDGGYRRTGALQAGIVNELWDMDCLHDEVVH